MNSQQKKTSRHRHIATEGNEVYPRFELEELVEETCKIYRLPPVKRSREDSINSSQLARVGMSSKKESKRTVLPSLKVWLSRENTAMKSNKETIASKSSKGQLQHVK
jgi:hypothetical protein